MLDLNSLVCALPEDVLRRRMAGDLEEEIALIDDLLALDSTPPLLRSRLAVERAFARRIPQEYTVPKAKALEMIRARIPGFTMEEMEALERARAIEYCYIRGEIYYLHSFLDTLLKVHPDLAARAGIAPRAGGLSQLTRELAERGRKSVRIRMRMTLSMADECFAAGGRVQAFLPLPKLCAQQSDIEVLPGAFRMAPETAAQRTAYFDGASLENRPFTVEYAYTSGIRYVDAYAGKLPGTVVYPSEPAPNADDVSEQLPHIAFTPFLRHLAAQLSEGANGPLDQARSFYDYITRNIRYSYMRPYFLMENQAEGCALNGKGDCGIQALLFITLCRIAGIPARWQSGMAVDERSAGDHDWAQFYVEPCGWLFCDPSYGGGARREEDEARRRFYFGNLDPLRMVANSRYQTDFDPPCTWDRSDPYDNQDGEICVDGRALTGAQWKKTVTTVKLDWLD